MQARNIHKAYSQGTGMLDILKGIDLQIDRGEAVSIVGASGAGKSTLLHILGTLDRPDQGDLYYKHENLLKKTDDELAEFRNKKMGFVFQFHHLLSEFTALENIMMPGRISGMSRPEAKGRAVKLLDQVGLLARSHHYPSQLSGGEQQRVAVARSLFCRPEVLFADEPTGNLDTQNSLMIQDLFFQLHRELGLTLITVTHDASFADKFPRQLRLKDGQWI
ncbi:MAG: ABC transporter ATP-binding protein [Bdellovibrionales bacterium]|nr:ABC transporter ATP-binding protein [Bdellovibrionales bacterium]